ncbi:MAG: hypothetical protein KOO63_12605 [Bacteroidales bacterium]|nr:hypothetical protein [Candidatus Latescibacterota bacterium]
MSCHLRNVLLVIMFLLFTSGIAHPQNNDPTSEIPKIINNALRVNCPNNNYAVNVQQRLYNDSNLNISRRPDISFRAKYSPDKGLKLGKISNNGSNADIDSPRIMVDLSTYLKSMRTYSNRTINEETDGNQSYYVIQGGTPNKEQECIIWINKDSYAIKRVILFLSSRQFARIDVESSQLKTFWLPDKISMKSPENETTAELLFTDYSL